MIFFVKMKSKNFVKYSFENYDVESFIGKINFSTEKDIKVITHEEIIQEIMDNEVEINNFEPIICSVESTSDVLKNDNLSSCELVLLDGHHRFDYIKRKQIDNFIDVIIVSDSDVSINSHCSELLVSKNEFEKILVENNFIKDTQLPFFVSLDNCKYSNETINNLLHTILDIGLPGRQKIILRSNFPIINGFPGFMGIPSTRIFIPSFL